MSGKRTITAKDSRDIALLLALLFTVGTVLSLCWQRAEALPQMEAATQVTSPMGAVSASAPAAPLVPVSAVLAPGLVPQAVLLPVASTLHLAQPAGMLIPTDMRPVDLISATPKVPADVKYFNGRKYRFVELMHLRVTAYAPDKRCCWPYNGTVTASGLSVKTNHGHLVAADTKLIPMHALVAVPGYQNGAAVPVLDRGGAIKGHRLDVLFPTFGGAQEWGARLLGVKIYLPVDD